jgi:predicted DNA-binding protein
MKRTSIYLSESQAKRLKGIAKKTGLEVSKIIRRMIDEGLKEHDETDSLGYIPKKHLKK